MIWWRCVAAIRPACMDSYESEMECVSSVSTSNLSMDLWSLIMLNWPAGWGRNPDPPLLTPPGHSYGSVGKLSHGIVWLQMGWLCDGTLSLRWSKWFLGSQHVSLKIHCSDSGLNKFLVVFLTFWQNWFICHKSIHFLFLGVHEVICQALLGWRR